MCDAAHAGLDVVDACPACTFKSTIPDDISGTTYWMAHYPIFKSYKEDFSEMKLKLPMLFSGTSFTMSAQKDIKKELRSFSSLDFSVVDFLEEYFSATRPTESPRLSPNNIISKLRGKKKTRVNRNLIQGCLVFPDFDFAIAGDCSNYVTFFDHHALASSRFSNQAPVLHGVPSIESANNAINYVSENNIILKNISHPTSRARSIFVQAPHNSSLGRQFTYEIFEIPTTRQTDSTANLKQMNDFSATYLASLTYASNTQFSKTADFTVVIGTPWCHLARMFSSPVLLLLRSHSIHSNDLTTKEKERLARDLYTLRLLAGKSGFELRRFCGSSGQVSGMSDRNLLTTLAIHRGALPRRLKGCLIMRDVDRYHITYRRTSEGSHLSNSSNFSTIAYCPPQDGGPFSLPTNLLLKYPFLADFTYHKMLSTVFLQALNVERIRNGQLPVAQGAVETELYFIHEARHVYARAPEDRRMFDFLATFNFRHKYSMIAYPVGCHYDVFKEKRESLENKVLLTFPSKDKNLFGRGGSITGKDYVYALLDW